MCENQTPPMIPKIKALAVDAREKGDHFGAHVLNELSDIATAIGSAKLNIEKEVSDDDNDES